VRESVTHWSSASSEQTEAFGERLAQHLPSGANGPVVVYLTGDLGAGKTTFAQGFVRGCGITEAVRSPTYALLETYELAGMTVVHMDLYRLRDPSELEALGLRDWAQRGYLWLVEWPEKAGGKLPPADIEVTLRVAVTTHELAVSAASSFGGTWLASVNMS